MPSPDGKYTEPDREMIEYVRQLIELEDSGERTTLAIGPFAAFSLIGMLQLVTRHPSLSRAQKDIAVGLARQLEPLFTGTPGEEIVKKGYHPEWDR